MVRRLMVAMSLVVAICGSMATQAMAYTAYDGTPSSTYIAYFRDMLSKFSASYDYVVFRNTQYEYMLVVGDLAEIGGRIQSAGAVDICEISTNNGYNASYSLQFRSEESFVLDPGDEIIYSNLGLYPSLEERGDVVDYATYFLLAVIAVCCLFRGIFEWRKGICC